jgi:ABC-type glycerol-3-phosphate transport system substrate-binding protein
MYKSYKIKILMLIFIIFMTSCQSQNDHMEISITVKDNITPEENVSFLTDITPLEILYTKKGSAFWGNKVDTNDAMLINFLNLSNLCKEKLGFPIKFTEIPTTQSLESTKDSIYTLHIMAGLSGDLIFPEQSIDIHNKSNLHWGQQYLDLYMDLSPYLERFCPEAILNFEKYPQIKDNFIIDGKVYAIYTGMPSITALALMVKNELLEETGVDINTIKNVDALYEFMDNLYQGNEPKDGFNKIWVSGGTLLHYAICNSDYYEYGSSLFTMNDEKCTPYFLEDTEIIDYFLNKFNKFFINGYFTTDSNTLYENIIIQTGLQDMVLISWSPHITKALSQYTDNEQDNPFHKYSIVLFDDMKPVINQFNAFIHVMVPTTCTHPEKALIFMQWLMTDKEAADILTFGSQLMNLQHYRFSEDGRIIPEKNNTIYAFCNLIANFSDKAFLYGKYDVIHEYKEKTYQAAYPVLYRLIDSDNERYVKLSTLISSITQPYNSLITKRNRYLRNSIEELLLNPNSNLDAMRIKQGLDEIGDLEDYKVIVAETIKEALKQLMK